jgi:hypothetical protein
MQKRRWGVASLVVLAAAVAIGAGSLREESTQSGCVGIVVRDEPHPMTGAPDRVIYRAWSTGQVERRRLGNDADPVWEKIN